MEKEQVKEWAEAQKIHVSVDLVEATKHHLKFLGAIDRSRFLYEDHALERAIYRYNAFWLPLLAKHLDTPVCEGPLVVPLDCEWIWHCHRLNPVRYRFDCMKLFGRILGNRNVISSILSISKNSTEEIWKTIYPEEPYELDLGGHFSRDCLQKDIEIEKFTNYDLKSAVKRQISFTFQVSRPHMSDELFLREAMARYKGFLHLIRTNVKINQKQFSVPAYDIDLMWHTHQLYADSYCKDMIELVGFVIQHDDTDSDITKGSRLDVGQSETRSQWERTFGFGYWKAGAMYRGDSPNPVTLIPYEFNTGSKMFNAFGKRDEQIQFSSLKALEVLIDIVDIKNIPDEYKENLVLAISKKQADKFFSTETLLGISSNSKDKACANFNCEPKGEFLFELMSQSPVSNELQPKEPKKKLLGYCSLSLEELLASQSQLSANKWFSIDLAYGLESCEPILLHVSVSFTPPTMAPQLFQLVSSPPHKDDHTHTRVMDSDEKMIFSLHHRNIGNDATKCTSADLMADVYTITDSGEKCALIEYHDNSWCVKGTHGSFELHKSSGNDDSLFELVGYKMVKLFPGGRLEFEPRHNKCDLLERDLITAVEFSADNPYGRAVALINVKTGTIKAIEDWIVLPCITLAVIQSYKVKGEGHSELTLEGRIKESIDTNVDEKNSLVYGALCNRTCGGVCGYGPCRGGVDSEQEPKNDVFGALCNRTCGGVCGYGPCRGGVDSELEPKNHVYAALCNRTCGGVCGYGPCRGGVDSEMETKNHVYGALCNRSCGGVCGYGPCRGGVDSNLEPKNHVYGALCNRTCGGVCEYGPCRGGVDSLSGPNNGETTQQCIKLDI